jgi:tRNA (guanine37-N1)-methyltransferase
MQLDVITLLPEMFSALTQYGVTGRAAHQKKYALVTHNPRDFVTNVHKTIDDRPYGGGPGMLMLAAPLCDSIEAAKLRQHQLGIVDAPVVYLSPQGAPLTHQKAQDLSKQAGLILLCGRYEGIDERVVQTYVTEELSIGDYVLSGGELPAMVLMDAIIRLLPTVLNHEQSAYEDSFVSGLLDCPHYTRPELFRGMTVPEVLLSGNHALIASWRLKQALGRTHTRRPDLLKNRPLTQQESRLLAEYQQEQGSLKME